MFKFPLLKLLPALTASSQIGILSLSSAAPLTFQAPFIDVKAKPVETLTHVVNNERGNF